MKVKNGNDLSNFLFSYKVINIFKSTQSNNYSIKYYLTFSNPTADMIILPMICCVKRTFMFA